MSAVAPPAPRILACPVCRAPLATDSLAPDRAASCPQCLSPWTGAVFPAFRNQEPTGAGNAAIAAEGDAVCFFHPQNRAALSCERCGRFICAVCDLEVGARHICPTCLSSGLDGEKLPEVVPWRFLWSDAALLAGLIPILIGIAVYPVFIFSGPVAIFLALFGWRKPGSLTRGRRRWAAVVGIVLGVLQIAIWIGLLALIWGIKTR